MPISGWAPYWVMPEATASVIAYGSCCTRCRRSGTRPRVPPTSTFGASTAEQARRAHRHDPRSRAQGDPAITDGMPTGGMAAVLADPAQRGAARRGHRAMVRTNDFDGIDIDYEQFAFVDGRATWETTRPNWVAFIEELATALHAEGKLLTVSIPPIYDTERTATAATGSTTTRPSATWSTASASWPTTTRVGEPGPIAPLDWVRSACRRRRRRSTTTASWCSACRSTAATGWSAPRAPARPTAEGKVRPRPPRRRRAAGQARRHARPRRGTRESTFTTNCEVSDGGNTCIQTREVHFMDPRRARTGRHRPRANASVAWCSGRSATTPSRVGRRRRRRPPRGIIVQPAATVTAIGGNSCARNYVGGS